MPVLENGLALTRLKEFIGRQWAVIAEINRKYAEPRITMSRSVKLALLLLRFYLIFLVILLGYRFLTMLRWG